MLYQYERTPHLLWSAGRRSTSDIPASASQFVGHDVVITEKLDGRPVAMYADAIHGETIDTPVSGDREVMALWEAIRHMIPPGWRVYVEDMEMARTLWYCGLESYAYVVAIYDDDNFCLEYEDTRQYAEMWGIPTPPLIYEGKWDQGYVERIWNGPDRLSKYAPVYAVNQALASGAPQPQVLAEGYVVRRLDAFPFGELRLHAAKYVRSGRPSVGFGRSSIRNLLQGVTYDLDSSLQALRWHG